MTELLSGEELFRDPCWKAMPSDQLSSLYDFPIYNPIAVTRLLPDIRPLTETSMNKHEFYDSRVLIEPCPACGIGRTLFVHLARTVGPIVEANFKNWCQPCRVELARLADRFVKHLKK